MRNAERFPLSYGQHRLWFLDELEGSSAEYNIPQALRIKGRLDAVGMRHAVQAIVDRHEILRTRFVRVENEPEQVIEAELQVELPVEDLCDLDERAQREAVEGALRREWEEPFDLASGPLFRMKLLRLSSEEHVWIRTFHHIVFDAWSLSVFNHEFTELYGAYQEGRKSTLAALPVQYADFTLWQRECLDGETMEREVQFWKEHLAGIPEELDLPKDRPRAVRQSFGAEFVRMSVGRETTLGLKRLGQTKQATLYMTLLGGFAALLSRYSAQDDIVVGSPIANREEPQLEELIGFFVNTLVMRVRVKGEDSFSELLGRVRETALEAYRHQALPFERLVEGLSPQRSLNTTPIFQVLFAVQNAPVSTHELKGMAMEGVGSDELRVHFDLEVHAWEQDGRIDMHWVYNRDLFDRWRIEQMARHYGRLLEAVAAQPDGLLRRIDILGEGERRKILTEWNETEHRVTGLLLPELWEAQVERTPDAIAVISGEESLTYGEVNSRANQLAHYLIGLEVGPENLVGVCVERSALMVIAILAVLKAGAAYLPLDPDYPPGRLQFMVEDAKPVAVLTSTVTNFAIGPAEVLVVLDHADTVSAMDQQPQNNPTDRDRTGKLLAAHPIYVIYTSGSTGTPKGVVMHEGAFRNLLAWHVATIRGGVDTKVAQFTALSFDVAAQEILSTLMSGGSLVIPPGETRRNPSELAHWLERNKINQLYAPNLVVQALCRTIVTEGLGMNDFVDIAQAGEGLTLSGPVRAFFASGSIKRRLHNHYGPTETHVVTAWKTPTDPNEWPVSAPIGRPIYNTSVYVLDANLEPAPIGVTGELYIGGVAIARGYLKRPGATSERFIADPFGTPGTRMYRTGDLGRWQTDGAIELFGRSDDQVKIRGFRVELGEIEATIRSVSGVVQCAVACLGDKSESKRLVAFVVLDGSSRVADELRKQVRDSLPDHMVPASYIEVKSLPLLPNGKLNRHALRTLESGKRIEHVKFVPARNRLEKIVADVWKERLFLKEVSTIDNFFDLGGHSLLAIQVHAEICARTARTLKLTDIFKYPTVASLAEYLSIDEEGMSRSAVNESQAKPRHGSDRQNRLKKRKAAGVDNERNHD